MFQYHILARSRESARALQDAAHILCPHTLLTSGFDKIDTESQDSLTSPTLETIVMENVDDVLDAFRSIAAVFEKRFEDLKCSRRRQLVVLVDHVWLDRLDPLAEGGHWNALIGMLILAFPTIRWVFGVILHEEEKDGKKPLPKELWGQLDRLKAFHGLGVLTAPLWDSLFDGSGLRNFVRALSIHSAKKAGQPPVVLPLRPRLAVAIDEESSYCNFNALAAYRNGYRCFNVQTESVAASLLGHEGVPGVKWLNVGDVDLTLEDMHLNFPDRTKNKNGIGDVSLSDLYVREAKLPKLGTLRNVDGPKRVFVTTGRHRSDDESKWEQNEAYREQLAEQERSGELVNKPVSGIFRLWSLAKLGKAEGFQWPIQDDEEGNELTNEGHSARGRLLEISIALLARASRILDEVHSTSQAVIGAVLTTDALELLGGKTPTTSLEALALKHQFEVLAEVHFYGVGTKLEVTARIKDIQQEIKALSVHFDSENRCGTRETSKLNAQAAILGDLVKVFRDHNQFDEEQVVQCQARKVHFNLWIQEHARAPFSYPLKVMAWYFCFLLSSVPRFLAASTACILVLGLGFTFSEKIELKSSSSFDQVAPILGLEEQPSGAQLRNEIDFRFRNYELPTIKRKKSTDPLLKMTNDDDLLQLVGWEWNDLKANALKKQNGQSKLTMYLRRYIHGLEHAFTAFVSVGMPSAESDDVVEYKPYPRAFHVLSCLAMSLGFLHLGIFISHLYSLMSRR
jgi:hypothetical protein